MKNIFLLLIILALSSCKHDDIEVLHRGDGTQISIYLVKEGEVDFHEYDIDINSLELEKTPWVKSSDIDFYDWSSHSFYLKKEVEKGELSGRHFVVCADNEPLFVGIFWPMYMSSLPMIPAILPEDDWFTPKDVVRFSQFGFFRPGELDENTEFKQKIIAAGISRNGIKVELTSLKESGSHSVKYTFEVTNIDSENIYVLDPEKMGESRFHYYSNGVSLKKDDMYYWPSGFETTASEEIKSTWYYKLMPGRSITRTVTIDGFDSLPSGQVEATFRFPGTSLKETGSWKKKDGRIWIGDYYTETELSLR